MSQVEFLLTVGKLDASLALLTTDDHHVIEFPTVLLPDDVKAGSIVKLAVSQTFEEERKQRDLFREIQAKILEKYGTKRPSPPVLKVLNVTQTSCVLAWDPLQLGSANLKSLVLYRQGVRSTVIPCPLKTNTTKISGLSVDTDYEFELKLTTTSGQLWSEKVKTHTHKMTDMSGITVCLGPLDPLLGISGAQVAQSLSQIGAKPMQKKVAIDTTHFVTNDVDNDDDPELIKAKNSNIPIVRPEWVRASEMERRIVGVRGFYLDADQGILKSYQFPPASEEAKAAFSKLKAGETADNLNLNDKELSKPKVPAKEVQEDGKSEEAEEDTEKENGDRPRITEEDLKDAVEPSNDELHGKDVVEDSEVKPVPREITDSEVQDAVTTEVVAPEPEAVTTDAKEVAAVELEAATKEVEEVTGAEPEASKSEEDLAGPEKTEEEITVPEAVAAATAAEVTTTTEGAHEVGGTTDIAETAPETVDITEEIETVPLAEANNTVQETAPETEVVSPETPQVAEPLETVPTSAETETTATVDAVPTSAETETTAIAEVAPTTAETEATAAEVTESAEAAPSTAETEAETTDVPELQAVPEVEQEAPEALVEADVDSPIDPASGKVEGQLEETPEPTATPETVGTDSNGSVEENNEESAAPGTTTTKKTTKKNKNKKKNKKKK